MVAQISAILLQNTMMRTALHLSFLLLLLTRVHAATTEPLVGTWELRDQTVNGQKVETDPLTLRIYAAESGFEFAYSMPINGIHLVSMKFTSVRLDGTPGTIEDVRGNKVGTVKITKIGNLEYKAVIEGSARPKAAGIITISSDGKTLTSQSDSVAGGKTASHVVQVFARR